MRCAKGYGWEREGAKGKWACMGSDGITWKVDTDGSIWWGTSEKWRSVKGSAAQISVADRNNVWIVTPTGSIAYWLPSAKDWEAVKTPVRMARVAIGPKAERVVALSEDGDVYAWDPMARDWVPVPHKVTVKEISVCENYIVVTDEDNDIYSMHIPHPDEWIKAAKHGSWKGIEGKLTSIAIANGGYIIGSNHKHEVYERKGIDKPWAKLSPSFRQVDCNAAGTAVGVDPVSQEVYLRKGGSWESLPGVKVAWASIGGGDAVTGASTAGMLVRWNAATGKWGGVVIPDAKVAQVSSATGTAYFVTSDDSVVTYRKERWVEMGTEFCRVAVSPSGIRVVALNRKDEIFALSKVTGDWVQIPGLLREISLSDDYIAGTNADNNIFVMKL